MHFYTQEHLTFYKYSIHTNDIKKQEYTNVSQQLEIFKYVQEVQKLNKLTS